MPKRKPRYRRDLIHNLIGCGWRTPDTMGSWEYEAFPTTGGVYLLVRFNDFHEPIDVVYVGQSKDLAKRLDRGNHQIYKALCRVNSPKCRWVQRWFKSVPHAGIRRAAERHYIGRYNPPLNAANRSLDVRLAGVQ